LGVDDKIKYTDYDGNVREEEFYFNLNEAELVELEASYNGSLTATIERLSSTQDKKVIIEIFKDLVLKAYGEKAIDGRRFIKSQELRDSFIQTEAYNKLFMDLATDADAATAFLKGIVPEVKAPILSPA
jgi:hypothetical protein